MTLEERGACKILVALARERLEVVNDGAFAGDAEDQDALRREGQMISQVVAVVERMIRKGVTV